MSDTETPAIKAREMLMAIDPSTLSVSKRLRLAQLLIEVQKNLPQSGPFAPSPQVQEPDNSVRSWLLDVRDSGYLGEMKLTFSTQVEVTRPDLYSAYTLYCRSIGRLGVNPAVFGRDLRRQPEHLTCERRRAAGERAWVHSLIFSPPANKVN